MLLAQIPVDGMTLFGWLGSAGAVLFLLNQGGRFMDRFKETPPPNDTYVRKEQFKDQQKRIQDIGDDVNRLRLELQKQSEELRHRMDNLPAQIISVLRNTGAIGGK